MTSPTIIIFEEVWMGSQLSIARHSGGIKFNGDKYLIVNRKGISVFELSDPSSPHYVGDGTTKAIPAGESADLCRTDWVPIYRIVGRYKTLDMIYNNTTLDDAIELITKKKYDEIKKTMRRSIPNSYL